ncbi:MAG TPA: hypothetical protein VGC42_19385 [Kofleriaceae bacterium]
MQLSSWLPLSFALAAMFLVPRSPGAVTPSPARTPEHFAALLARYDHAGRDEQRALEPQLDAMAGQRYAASARLFWYTELDAAKQAARRTGRPILALRMLGDLREDLSCANSRLFRAVLYANTEVSALLRDQFILYWSSERDVPVVTIDFGGGRKIVRTTTGNSAHYVLDADGRVLDVLPGLYAPEVFRHELGKSLALAREVAHLDEAGRQRALRAYHREGQEAALQAMAAVADVPYIAGRRTLLGVGDIARAQMATMSKARIEVPDLRTIGLLGPGDASLDDPAAWSAIGQATWHLGPAAILDAPSRALVARLHDAGPDGPHTTPEQLAAVIARLEQHLVADTAINELQLRLQIRAQLMAGQTDFASLNDWIYANVFATPKTDPWLGLNPRTEFSGLPGDGVVVP